MWHQYVIGYYTCTYSLVIKSYVCTIKDHGNIKIYRNTGISVLGNAMTSWSQNLVNKAHHKKCECGQTEVTFWDRRSRVQLFSQTCNKSICIWGHLLLKTTLSSNTGGRHTNRSGWLYAYSLANLVNILRLVQQHIPVALCVGLKGCTRWIIVWCSCN